VRIKLLIQLANYQPSGTAASTSAGQALTLLYQRAAATALGIAGTTYAPSSYNDAITVRGQIVAVLDNQIEIAGDTFDDAVFTQLRDLRQNSVLDLNQRGAALPALAPVVTTMNLPDVALAMKLYGDPTRADGLVTQANPHHPLFMPNDFLALAS
jgi:prophage DNA circulation protein